MARGTALYDFKATDTRRTDLENDAEKAIARDVQLLDLWVSKELNIGSQRTRIRVGNQVISWGESLFGIGGIDSAMALDFQKFSIPGTQIKEAVLPAPMISVASGLGHGVNVEAFYQFRWNRYGSRRWGPISPWGISTGREWVRSRLIPTSSTSADSTPRRSPAPATWRTLHQTQQDLVNGVYFGDGVFDSVGVPFAAEQDPEELGAVRYRDAFQAGGNVPGRGVLLHELPRQNAGSCASADGRVQWNFLENRKLYGISTNFPLGNWAVGWRLSYRPKDAVALTFPYGLGGRSIPSATASSASPPRCGSTRRSTRCT